MQYKYAEIADTVYFWFAANDTTGTAADGATPLYDVRLAGAASDAIPTASGTPTLLTHANYSNGLHEIAIDTTGYAAGEYAVFCTLTVSTVNPAGFCGSFKLRTAGTGALKVDTVAISGDTTAADNLEAANDGTGYAGGTIKPKVDVDTIKTQAVTCGAGVTVLASVGTAATSTAQTGDSYAIINGINGCVAIKSDTAAILADTGTDGVVVAAGSKTGYSLAADQSGVTVGTVTTVTTATNLTNAPTTGDLTTAMKASVNTEILDVLNTDTFAEPGQGAPGATVALTTKIGYLYKFARNKIEQTATELKIYNDAGSVVDQKSTCSDDATTYTRGELGTGP